MDNQNQEEIPIKELTKEFRNSEVQGILKKMSLAYSEPTGAGFFTIYEILQMLIAKHTDQALRDHWKERFEQNMTYLRHCGVLVSNLNFFLMFLDTKLVLEETDPTNALFIRYRKMFAECSFYLHLLYDAYYTMLNSTPRLKFLNIPNEYWAESKKIIEERQ